MSLENVHDLVVRGKAKLVPAAVQETLDEGVEASKILDTMISAMDVVGENFKNGTIGKNLVAMMIESAGFEVIDLGVDVPVEKFLSAYEENPGTKIVACSALLTTTMPALQETVTALNAAPWRKDVKVMVGGAPITQEFADKIGADAYTPDAASAAKKAKELVA